MLRLVDEELRVRELLLDFDPRAELFALDERELDPLLDEPDRDLFFEPEALPRPERLDPLLPRELRELCEPELEPLC